MKRLLDLTVNFEKSRPIFRLTKQEDSNRISAELYPAYKYTPTPEEGDVLSELVCENFKETFNATEKHFRISREDIAHRSMQDIRNAMPQFLEKNLEMRNPRQSKIYRWFYRELPNDDDFNDGLCLLYKYMRSFSHSDMKADNIEHINNAIAVMEAIMEKYK